MRGPRPFAPSNVSAALESICLNHAPLQQANEVAVGSKWVARRLSIELSEEVANVVEKVDDDLVGLIALDLYEQNLLPYPDNGFELWSSYMGPVHLYSEHWLLAYEARVHDWLPSLVPEDYISDDPYFKILSDCNVRFYDHDGRWKASTDSEYGDEIEEEFYVPEDEEEESPPDA